MIKILFRARTALKHVAVLCTGLAFMFMLNGCGEPHRTGNDMADTSKTAGSTGKTEKVTLWKSDTHLLRAEQSGYEYRLYVALPEREEQHIESALPVVYVLDADGFFAMFTEVARNLQSSGEIPPFIMVGIGYPVETFTDTITMRLRDFTPDPDSVHGELVKQLAGSERVPPSGEAKAFLDFIRGQVKPFMAQQYAVDESRSTLVGHSLGGLFALYALFSDTDAFQNYIIGSPPILWAENAIVGRESAYANEHDALPARVFMGVGSEEDDLARVLNLPDKARHLEREFIEKVGNPDPVAQFREFVNVLEQRDYRGLTLEWRVFENQTHASVPAYTFVEGLRSVWRDSP